MPERPARRSHDPSGACPAFVGIFLRHPSGQSISFFVQPAGFPQTTSHQKIGIPFHASSVNCFDRIMLQGFEAYLTDQQTSLDVASGLCCNGG
jgi:hypothetical protein